MLEFIPLLDKYNNVPIYVQLYQYIKQKIEEGSIQEGSILPSIRYLSGHLKVSKTTIEGAYQQLIAEGYVESKPRVGLIVLPLEQTVLLPSFSEIKSKPCNFNKEEMFEYDFKYGDIDLDSFPLNTWKRCLTKALTNEPEQLLHYGPRQGDIGLRRELMDYLFQARGVNCSIEQIIICSGTQHAISLIIQLLSSTDRSVAMENPSYGGSQSVFSNHEWTIHPIPLEQDGIDVTQLKKTKAKVAYITPSHQFPYGMVLPIQKRLSILDWANKNNSFIIEDDYDSEFRYQGKPIPALKALDVKEKVIYLGTFSKSFSPAARVNYIVLPQSLIDVYNQIFINYNQSVSPIIQKGLYIFMNEGHFQSHIRRMRKVYQRKHQLLVNSIIKYMGNKVEIIGQKAGLHLLVKVKNVSTKELINKAKKVGVRVYEPPSYYANEKIVEQSIVMIGFGGIPEEKIVEGIILLRKAWFSKTS